MLVQEKADGKDGLNGSGNLVLREEESAISFSQELYAVFAHALTITYISFGYGPMDIVGLIFFNCGYKHCMTKI